MRAARRSPSAAAASRAPSRSATARTSPAASSTTRPHDLSPGGTFRSSPLPPAGDLRVISSSPLSPADHIEWSAESGSGSDSVEHSMCSEAGDAAARPCAGRGQRGKGRRRLPDTADPCYHRLRTGVPFMRITRNRADASPRPTGSTRHRSARLNLTEPRQTNLIAPSPPDQIGTTPKNPSQTEKSRETDHRRPRSPAPPWSTGRWEMEMTRRSPEGEQARQAAGRGRTP